MKTIYDYIILENDLDEITSMIAPLKSLKEIDGLLKVIDTFGTDGKHEDRMKAKIVSRVLNNLIDDKDIQDWYATSSNNEYDLRRILLNKLTPREARYIDDICSQFLKIGDNDEETVNNIMLRLLQDNDIQDWYKNSQKKYELYVILTKKLRGNELKQIDNIIERMMDLV